MGDPENEPRVLRASLQRPANSEEPEEKVMLKNEPSVQRVSEQSRASSNQPKERVMLKASRVIGAIRQKSFAQLEQRAKSVHDQKVDEIADIIRLYRDVQEENDDVVKIWVDQPRFDLVMSFVIVMNSIVIGIETDYGGDSRHWVWFALEICFCIIFFAEIGCKCAYHTWRWIFGDIWNMVAVLVAILAFVDVAVLGLLGAHGNLRLLSLLRVVGLVRLLRIVKMYRNLKELRLVIKGLVGSAGMLCWVILICFVFLYVSGIFMTTVVGHDVLKYKPYRKVSGGWDHEEHFGTILRSMNTLLQVMTLDGWSSRVARHVLANQWHMALFFIIFILVTTYGLVNLVTGVIVEQILAASQSNDDRIRVREERARRLELESMREIFYLCDADRSGTLDCHEFLEAIQDPEVQWRMRELELPVDDALRLFNVIDGDGSRSLLLNEFINGCMKLKGPAMSKDLLAVQGLADTLAKQMDGLGCELQECERMIAQLDEISDRMDRRFGPTMNCSREKIARAVGGSAPIVPIKTLKAGRHDLIDLSVGNRPALPNFPGLLK